MRLKVRVGTYVLNPQTSRSSCSRVKTRSGSDASFTSSANSFAERSISYAVRHRPARRAVDRERPDLEPLDARRAAPQQRVDAREELLVDERPREAVVGVLERAHASRWIGSTEHDHRAVGDEAAVERFGVAEEQDVGVGGARQLLGALVREHVEAVVPQLPLEEPAHGRLRFCENECRHGYEPTPRTATRL